MPGSARAPIIGTGTIGADNKAIVDWTRKAARRSVRTIPRTDGGGPTGGYVFYLAQQANECPDWWTPARDVYLRKFWPSEPFLAGAIYSIAARNAAYKFELIGPDRPVERTQRMLAESQLGKGWHSYILKLTLDLLTQDNGGFCEIIRPARIRVKNLPGRLSRWNDIPLEGVKTGTVDLAQYGAEYIALAKQAGIPLEIPTWSVRLPTGGLAELHGLEYDVKDSPRDLPLGLAHLDAGRCQRTGNPEIPVIYTDLDGKRHKMKWWQVMTFEDLPSPQEEMYDVQHCMVTRVFRLAQTLRDMQILMQEKASGRFAGRVYLTNVSADAIQDAVNIAKEGADARGLMRYMPPILADTVDPHAEPKVATIDLANLPEGFDFDMYLQWYIAGTAMGSGVDYGFLAPLPGKGLGTASQSEVQERQARGKSSRLFQGTMEHHMNYGGVLPRSVLFGYTETDYAEEAAVDAGKKTRAETRKILIETGEITAEVARQMAVDGGDYPESYLTMMGESDVTPVKTADDAKPVAAQDAQAKVTGEITPKKPEAAAKPGPGGGGAPAAAGEKGGPGSGFFAPDHQGRPGEQGGSTSAGGMASDDAEALAANKRLDQYLDMPDSVIGAVAEDAYRGEVKDGIVLELVERLGYDDPTSEEGFKAYQDVNDVLHAWSMTAADRDMRALSLQEAAAGEFDVPVSSYVRVNAAALRGDLDRIVAKSIEGKEVTTDEHMAYMQTKPGWYGPYFPHHKRTDISDSQVLRAMYQETQETLQQKGLKPNDTIRLYRGVRLRTAQADKIRTGQKRVKGNPLESWTTDKSTAANFGYTSRHLGHQGLILTYDVPVRDIVATARTGLGCLPEGEVIVLGSRAYKPDQVETFDESAARGFKAEGDMGDVIDISDQGDWIKGTPGYKNEAEIYKIPPREVGEKGGAGSGYHGHGGGAGGPGNPGGSRARGAAVTVAQKDLLIGVEGGRSDLEAVAGRLGWTGDQIVGLDEEQLRQIAKKRISPPVGEWLARQGDIVTVYHGTSTDRMERYDVRGVGIPARASTFTEAGQEAGVFVVPAYNKRWAEYWANKAAETSGGKPALLELQIPKGALRVDPANKRDFLYTPVDVAPGRIGTGVVMTPTATKDFQFHVEVPHPQGGPSARVDVKDILAGKVVSEKQTEPIQGLGDPLPEDEALAVNITSEDVALAVKLWDLSMSTDEPKGLLQAREATPEEEQEILEREGA